MEIPCHIWDYEWPSSNNSSPKALGKTLFEKVTCKVKFVGKVFNIWISLPEEKKSKYDLFC